MLGLLLTMTLGLWLLIAMGPSTIQSLIMVNQVPSTRSTSLGSRMGPRPSQAMHGHSSSTSYDLPVPSQVTQLADSATQQVSFASLRVINDFFSYFTPVIVPRREHLGPRTKRLAFGGRTVMLSKKDQQILSLENSTLAAEQWATLHPHLQYLHPNAQEAVKTALGVAVAAHAGQKRKSGEWFISHPVAVTIMLAQHRMELDLLIAALLHDTVEDTLVTLESVRRIFGHTVSSLVEGVTKITELRDYEIPMDKETKNVYNIQSMLLHMASDYRVVILKLFDRLHNMRTLMHMKPQKQKKIAQETFDIFVPIADRLGLTDVKVELENLSFQYVYPEAYRQLSAEVQQHKELVKKATDVLEDVLMLDEVLQRVGITVVQAPTEMYRIWRHMKSELPLQNQKPMLGLKVVLEVRSAPGEDLSPYFSRGELLCYEVLHNLPFPVDIAEHVIRPAPNNNNKESWSHQPLNVVIFSSWMDPMTSYPTSMQEAVHALRVSSYEVPWLQPIKEWAQEVPDAAQFVSLVQHEVLSERISVLLPDDTTLDLAKGATVLDAAFHISPELALRAESGLVDGSPVPLSHVLSDGHYLSLVLGSQTTADPEWLQHVRTYVAFRQIRGYFNLESAGYRMVGSR